MKKRFHRRLPLLPAALTTACLAATLATSTVQAGVIEADLQQAMLAGGDVTFIVQFADQIDTAAFPGKGKLPPTQQRIRDLESQVKRLQMEKDILKKAAAFFAKEST